jgi:SAM-dependent methyltransferase
MTTGSYNAAFYDRADRSMLAARSIIPILRSFIQIGSVLDVGCARGAWLSAWAETGCTDFMGIDGATVAPAHLAIDPARFVATDLSVPFNLGRRFDFVQCLEVAEHLPLARSKTLVADLVSHSDVVLFSAAPPGQGGEHHINEQPYEFWRRLFGEHDYIAFDCLRPMVRKNQEIPFWYRYNAILYVKSDAVGKLSAQATLHKIAPGRCIPDISPPAFRIRKTVVRLLPGKVTNLLARIIAASGP